MAVESAALNAFMGALYLTPGKFSYLRGFVGDFWARLEDSSLTPESLDQLLGDYCVRISPRGEINDEKQALGLLRSRDLAHIRETLRSDAARSVPLTSGDITRSLDQTAHRGYELLAAHGIEVDPLNIVVVDQLPRPYDGKAATALVIDAGDEREYGVAQGVYFMRSNLRPFYSDFLYLHEILHVILGKSDYNGTAHGLEEGLADFLGSIWLSSHILGVDLTRHLFILNRLSSSYAPYWERYLDSARHAFLLFLKHGLDGLLRILAEGRTALYQIEDGSYVRVTRSISITFDSMEEDSLFRLGSELLLTYPRAFVVSPPAFLFAEQAQSGLSVREIGARAGLTAELAKAALDELRDEYNLVALTADERIVMEGEAATILARSWLRYRTDA